MEYDTYGEGLLEGILCQGKLSATSVHIMCIWEDLPTINFKFLFNCLFAVIHTATDFSKEALRKATRVSL